MIEGDIIYCIKDFNCIRFTHHYVVGEKFKIVKIYSNSHTIECFNIRNDKRDTFLSFSIAREYFETIGEHRKRIIEELI